MEPIITDDLECIGRIIRLIKSYRLATGLPIRWADRNQYLKKHLSSQDWTFWQELNQKQTIVS